MENIEKSLAKAQQSQLYSAGNRRSISLAEVTADFAMKLTTSLKRRKSITF